ncbi:PfkB family carbohydrate kinase, partial [Pseudostreptobacillus hongkongensis]|uniref:PfkB family carbohydrate kinase n=1 Tax=Pseudostreptobacillus hongkongensis TaxID=1162717 RepID=UPI0034E0ABC6
MKPNKIGVELLTGAKITDNKSMNKVAKILIERGIINVYITIGKNGVVFMNKDKTEFIPNLPVK